MATQQRVTLDHTYLDTMGPEQAWLIGLLASDGCITNEKSFSLGQSGEHGLTTLSYCKELLNHTGVIYQRQPNKGAKAYSLYVPSVQLVKRLTEFGLTPKKSLIYQFPTNLPIELLSSFVRGYIDGDGCVGAYKNGGSNHYLKIGLFGNSNFIQPLNELVPIKGRTSLQSNGTQIWWNGSKAVQFGKWVFQDSSLFQSKKYLTFWKEESTQGHYEATRKAKYDPLKLEALSRVLQGESPMKLAKELGIPFQTIYQWKSEEAKKFASLSENMGIIT